MDPTKISTTATISGLYQQQVPAQASTKQPDKDSSEVASEAFSAVDTIKIRSSVTSKNLDTVRAIEQMHAQLNQVAKGVRETNESVNKATEHVDAMKNSLQIIIKNFPPFSLDSDERMQRLMEYTSLRKELISLMVPPPPPAPYEKVKHLWEALFDENGKVLSSVIPQLENRSSDPELKDTAQALDKTSLQLTDLSNKVTQALVQA